MRSQRLRSCRPTKATSRRSPSGCWLPFAAGSRQIIPLQADPSAALHRTLRKGFNNAPQIEAENDVGYVQITSFNEQTTADLQTAVENLKKQIGPKLKGYIIDLRNNPGGLLDQAISVSDAFLDQGAIVLTKGRNLEETQRANARPGDLTDGKPLIVLINGGSASASEIVAGALQDHHRATILGTRSFGKGSVQTIIPLGSNGALRLTTARYYTPSGRSIQAKGIEPEVVVEEDCPTT